EEEILISELDFVQDGEDKNKKNKELLIISECGVLDYKYAVQGYGLAKYNDLTERIIANVKQTEVYSKIKVDINIDSKTKVVGKIINNSDKIKDISSSIWAPLSKSS
ncbi:2691_t:CDS:2, partial [Gigaspora margarita]